MNDLDLCLKVVWRSRQPLRYIWRWISRKPLEIEVGSKGPPIANGIWAIKRLRDRWHHVTPKVLWGSTVGYPSDSLAVLNFFFQSIKTYAFMNKQESSAVADEPARRESMPKIAPIRRAYNVVADWSIFIHLAVVASDICEIPRNSLKILTYRVQGHPRSSILVAIESAYATSY